MFGWIKPIARRLLQLIRLAIGPVLPRPSVDIEAPSEPLYVGSYLQLRVRNRGIALEDLDFTVPMGPRAGMVSASRTANLDASAPTVLLGAGSTPGNYRLEARDGLGNVLASLPFEVTDRWSDRKQGPSQWVHGEVFEPTMGAAWGGGPVGVQNAAVLGHVSGPWRVAIVLVDVDDALSPFSGDSDKTTRIKSVYERAVFDVADRYYREVSGGEMSLPGSSADVFGPVSLPGDWEEYFYTFRPSGTWAPRDELMQAVITATDDSIDFRNYDTVLIVSSGGSGGGRYPWPFAWGGTFTSEDGPVNLRFISMPPDSTIGSLSPRPVDQVVIHELGHNLGLWDLYFPDHGRTPDGLDPMVKATDYKHLSAMHRLMLGWLDPDHVHTLNVGAEGTAVDETVTLSPINRPGHPPAGAKKAVEVRVADGHNYYFEYRRRDSADFGDEGFSGDGMVIMTDTISYTRLATTLPDPAGSGEAPPAASPIQHMRADPDGDPTPESFLRVGADYAELDVSAPTAPAFFRAETLSLDSSSGLAEVRFTWDLETPVTSREARPDPSIREWPSDDNRWQSPDIEVRNPRNWNFSSGTPLPGAAGWWNVPWEGHDNTVVAKVRNMTPVPAEDVTVRFYVKDFSVSGAPLSFLGSDTKLVPGSGSSGGMPVEFTTTWRPAIGRVEGAEVHYCIVANIDPWASATLSELDSTNNHAQSNYTRMISESASPHSREVTRVLVSNPYEHETMALLRLSQSNPLYRSYLEHKWLVLGSHEERSVQVMSEYVGFETDHPDQQQPSEKKMAEPNDLQVGALVLSGLSRDAEAPEPMRLANTGGVSLAVTQGKRTEFEEFEVGKTDNGVVISGRIRAGRARDPIKQGRMILIFESPGRGEEFRPRRYHQVEMVASGFEVFDPEAGWDTVQAYFAPPDHGYGEAYSPILANPLKTRIGKAPG